MSGITPNLLLTKWTVGGDYFSRATLAANDDLLDAHDHTPDKGARIPTGGLENLAVTTTKIADLAVTTAKIADDSVTAAKVKADAWTDYAATVSSTSLDGASNTNVGRYIKLGRVVHAYGKITLGSGGSLTGATDIRIALPVTAASVNGLGSAYGYDSSSGKEVAGVAVIATTTTIGLRLGQDGAVGVATPLKATAPWTWADGDQIRWAITYESAA